MISTSARSTLFPYTTLFRSTPFNQILKQNAKREMRLRLGKVTVADVLAAQPVTTNLLKFMRASIKMSRFVVTGYAAKTSADRKAVQQECRDRSRMPSSA